MSNSYNVKSKIKTCVVYTLFLCSFGFNLAYAGNCHSRLPSRKAAHEATLPRVPHVNLVGLPEEYEGLGTYFGDEEPRQARDASPSSGAEASGASRAAACGVAAAAGSTYPAEVHVSLPVRNEEHHEEAGPSDNEPVEYTIFGPSPDGQLVAAFFVKGLGRSREEGLEIARADHGSPPTRIRKKGMNYVFWSPDSTRILTNSFPSVNGKSIGFFVAPK